MVVNQPSAAAVLRDSNCLSLQHNDDSKSPTLPSEFDLSNMDRYFSSYDGDLFRSPDSRRLPLLRLLVVLFAGGGTTTLESSSQRNVKPS